MTVDHGMRPGSAADAAFVADHAKALGLPAGHPHPGRPGPAPPGRPRGAARAARYEALWPAADELGCPWLATGHTLDDQAETVLLQLLRGAGPDGLAAMAVRAGRLLRPLLGVRRAETRACCAAAGLAWREDPTNAGDGPLRNRVRHHLLPLLEAPPGAPRPWPAPPPWPPTSATGSTPWSPPPWPGLWTVAAPRPAVGYPPGRGPHHPGVAVPDARSRGSVALDALTPDLPVALGRRVVGEAARQAGRPSMPPPPTGAGLTDAADRGGTGWPGGSAAREGTVVRVRVPPD